jgi:hypothetical protein
MQQDVPQSHDFGRDVAETVNAQQRAVIGADNQFQQPAVTGDRPPRSQRQVAAAQLSAASRSSALMM